MYLWPKDLWFISYEVVMRLILIDILSTRTNLMGEAAIFQAIQAYS